MKTSDEILEYVQQEFLDILKVMERNLQKPLENSEKEKIKGQKNNIHTGQLMALERTERFIKEELEK